MSFKALKANNDIYEKGIWSFLVNNKTKYYDFTTKIMGFKKMGTIFSILDLLRYNEIFCIGYTLTEGCSKCNYFMESMNQLKPYFILSEEDLNNNIKLENKIYQLLSNDLTQCSICGFTKDGSVIDALHPNYYRIIQNITLPKYIFFSFDLLNSSDEGSEIELKMCEFRRRIQYKKELIEKIKDNFKIFETTYYLRGIICTPKFNHFTALIINNQYLNLNLELGVNYYYDGNSDYHNINKIVNVNHLLEKDLPYLALYCKN